MTSNQPLQGIFTSQQAVTLFQEHTGFEFHPTVPGTLLARSGIHKTPSKSRPSTYDAQHWPLVWDLMIDLAHDRCRYDRALQQPRMCVAPALFLASPLTMPPEPARPRETAVTATQSPPKRTKPEMKHGLRRHPTRRFIEVKFSEKDEAKQLGARWEPTVGKWYVPAGLNRKLFRWADALISEDLCALQFLSDKRPKRPRPKKSPSADRSTISNKQIHKVLDARLDFLLDKPD